MDDIYRDLQAAIVEMKLKAGGTDITDAFSCPAFDVFLEDMPESKIASTKPSVRRKVSFGDLRQFLRVGNDVLIHKCDRDLWKLTKDADGNDVIERLYEGDVLNY